MISSFVFSVALVVGVCWFGLLSFFEDACAFWFAVLR
jgi:hypothetical protein